MQLRNFVSKYAKNRFSHDAAYIVATKNKHYTSMLMLYVEIPRGHKMIIFSGDSPIEAVLASSHCMLKL